MKMTAGTLYAKIKPPPENALYLPKSLSLDKGFDYEEVRQVLAYEDI